MKTDANNENDPSCELTQLSISDAIDANESLNRADIEHIESCAECAKFHQLWQTESPVSTIASGPLIEQQNLTQPIIFQLEKNAKTVPLKEINVIRGKFFKLASIAAVIAIVSMSAFTFYGTDEGKPTVADAKTPGSKKTLNIKIPTIKIKLTLTEAEIEESLEKNYTNLSESASEKWKTATTGIARATEYIANRTHYISNKYLTPINDGPSGPQSQSTPQQAELNPLQYG